MTQYEMIVDALDGEECLGIVVQGNGDGEGYDVQPLESLESAKERLSLYPDPGRSGSYMFFLAWTPTRVLYLDGDCNGEWIGDLPRDPCSFDFDNWEAC